MHASAADLCRRVFAMLDNTLARPLLTAESGAIIGTLRPGRADEPVFHPPYGVANYFVVTGATGPLWDVIG